MKAKVVYIDLRDGAETIEVNGHRIQFGYGSGGDGYCYAHGKFSCLDNLTDEERAAVQEAE